MRACAFPAGLLPGRCVPKPRPESLAAMEPSWRPRGGRGWPDAFPGLRLKGVPGLPTWSGQTRAREGLPSQAPGCLAPNPETPPQGPLPTAFPASYLPLTKPHLLTLSHPVPSAPPATPILPNSSPRTQSTDRPQEGQSPRPTSRPPSLGHSLAWNRVRFWAGPQREWAVGASWPHLAICQVGVGMGPVPGTGDMAVTETARDSARSRPAQERPSPEPSTATSTGLH